MKIALPEQVTLDFVPAHFGSRSVAYVCDFLIRWSAIALLLLIGLWTILLTGAVDATVEVAEKATASRAMTNLIVAAGVLLVFIIEWSYTICFEVFNKGVTPGKFLVGLRVVDESGLPISFKASFLRTVLLIVDLLPATGVVGLLFMCGSKRHQRLGDIVARTLVVYDTLPLTQLPETTAAVALPGPLHALIERLLSRRFELLPGSADVLARSIAEIARRVSGEANSSAVDTPWAYLENLYKRSYPTRIGEGHLHLRDSKIWLRDTESLEHARAAVQTLSSDKLLAHGELKNAIAAYQQLCNTYARRQAWYVRSRAVEIPASLVRRMRTLIYGQRGRRETSESGTLLERVRLSFEASKRHCAFSTAISVLAALLTWLAVGIHPEFGWRFVDEGVAADLQSGRLWTESIRDLGSIASAGIMTNNISVAFNAFAMGVTAGLGTIAILLFNGIHLGGTFAALVPYGMAPKLLGFIIAHGFLELSIIFVAGGCGLFLGDGIINPGRKTRREALQEHAAKSADLLVYSAFWLVAAGAVEGFVSPNPAIPWPIKLAVGVALGAIYWWTILGTPAVRGRKRIADKAD